MSELQIFLPHPALRPYIQCYVSLKISDVFSQKMIETTPPLPTKAIMFWYSQNPFRVYNSHGFDKKNPQAFFIPQYTCPNSCEHLGDHEFFTVTFWPGKMRHLFRFPWLEVMNNYIPLEVTEDQLLIDLAHRMEDAISLEERASICDKFLLKRLPNGPVLDDQMQHALNLLIADQSLTVYDLARKMHYSERQFRRRYKETFGIPPVGHRRLLRFLKAYNWLQSYSHRTLIEATEAFHYVDPSHLYKDFKHYTGKSPKQYLRTPTFHKKVNWREHHIDY